MPTPTLFAVVDFAVAAADREVALAQLDSERPIVRTMPGCVDFRVVADAIDDTVPRSLARRFEQELGMTWRAALRRLRVLRAIEQLVGTERPVTEIAMDVGYSSLSAFQTAFRDLTGQTPSEFRAGCAP